MDRRKLQIQKNVEEINEEKELLQLLMDKIVHQVRFCVNFVNTATHLKQKDCTMILNYELDVLKKIIEINCELETILDKCPINQIVTNGIGEFNTEIEGLNTKLEVVGKEEPAPEIPQNPLNIGDSQSTLVKTPKCVVPSLVQRRESVNYCERKDIQGNFSDADIQIIRDTLRESIERYYNRTAELFEKPSTTKAAQTSIKSSNIVSEKTVSEGFEVPEKDTNKTILGHTEVSPEPKSSTSFNGVFDDSVRLPPTHDDSSSTGSSANAIETEELNDKVTHCLIPLVDENSVVIDNIIDYGNFTTDDNTDSGNNTYTALEKLNNMPVLDRRAEAVAKMQVVNLPDISLKPTEHRIRNNLEPNDRKSKKQKRKKNKNKETEYYELVPKLTPQVDTLCAFSHVESPNEFYIHIVDEESAQIDSITEQLNAQFRSTSSDYSSKEEAANAIGMFCIAFLITYNSWYRAEVLNWELESKSEDVLVQFVDYGNKRRVSFKNLRRMTKEMSEIPVLAVRCHLPLLYPPKSTNENRLTEWPTATIDALVDLSGLMGQNDGEQDKIFRIVYINQEEMSFSIDMHNLRDDEEHTVGQILLDLGLAEQITNESEADHPELEVFLRDVDYLEDADNINEAVMGYDPRDEMRICRFAKSDGTCFKGKNCKLEHAPLSKDGFTTDQMLVFNEAMYSLTLPEISSYVNILITGCKDVCNFFAQLVSNPHKENGYMIDSNLYTLLSRMNHAKTVRSYEAFKMPPALGEIVIVKHSSGKFLRAKVREEIEGATEQLTKYQVFTVDFGEYLTVSPDKLRKIKPHFLELPFQAVECYLHNYVAGTDCDRKKARNFFMDHMYYRNFIAEVMSTSLPLRLAVTTFDRRDIGKMLAKEGLAEQRVCDKNPAEGCGLLVY